MLGDGVRSDSFDQEKRYAKGDGEHEVRLVRCLWLFSDLDDMALFGSPVLIPIVFGLIYVPSYRGSLSSEVFTVDRRERVVSGAGENSRSYYLVWTKEGEVFCVTDTWSFMRFDSSDRYGRLRENCRVKANVAGWRIPFLSWYRNIVEIEDIQETE